jgi:hypothetical protein
LEQVVQPARERRGADLLEAILILFQLLWSKVAAVKVDHITLTAQTEQAALTLVMVAATAAQEETAERQPVAAAQAVIQATAEAARRHLTPLETRVLAVAAAAAATATTRATTKAVVAVAVSEYSGRGRAVPEEQSFPALVKAEEEVLAELQVLNTQALEQAELVVFMAALLAAVFRTTAVQRVLVAQCASSGRETRAASRQRTQVTCDGTLHSFERRSTVRASDSRRKLCAGIP